MFEEMDLRNNDRPLLKRLQRQVECSNEIIKQKKVKFEKEKKNKDIFNLLEEFNEEETKPTRLKLYKIRGGR
jgi:hypothetical protein